MPLIAEEKRLLRAVTDQKLNVCLQNIRLVVETLWESGLRIITGYTDHGLRHYERIVGYTINLLDANQGDPLTTTEAFLLLGGIYLHDIGMQRDVITEDGKEIKKRAEALGAKFQKKENGVWTDLVFTATSATNYSQDEQVAIRMNHHYLSAAWIQYAHETGRTELGPAARLIQDDLVEDLMDMCLYHTSLPITECSLRLKGGGAGRKQLVAALLRFADELDIDSNRVENAVINDFSLNPENSVHWWLHRLTKVTFMPPNVFKIVVRLREQDYNEFAAIIQSVYLDRFREKNQPVLEVMQDQRFPIHLDAYGGVVKLQSMSALPDPVRLALHRLAAASTKTVEADVSHPSGTEEQRGSLHPCRFFVSTFYDGQPLWNRYADVLVEVIGLQGKGEVYLIPSGHANPRLRHTRSLKINSSDLNIKRQATIEFINLWGQREISGMWFIATKKGATNIERVKVYSPAYDSFLNKALQRLGENP